MIIQIPPDYLYKGDVLIIKDKLFKEFERKIKKEKGKDYKKYLRENLQEFIYNQSKYIERNIHKETEEYLKQKEKKNIKKTFRKIYSTYKSKKNLIKLI